MYHTYHALMLSHQTHVLWLPDRCVPQNALHRLPILSDPDHLPVIPLYMRSQAYLSGTDLPRMSHVPCPILDL